MSFGQVNTQVEIFETVIYSETEKGSTNLYIQCEEFKTFFNKAEFKEGSSLQVPDSILNELENSSKKSFDTIWDLKVLRTNEYHNLHHLEKCLTKNEVIDLFNSTKNRQSVLSISQPIFDSTFEHCVVSITYSTFIGSANGRSYFLKKIYGKWIVIETFGIWLS